MFFGAYPQSSNAHFSLSLEGFSADYSALLEVALVPGFEVLRLCSHLLKVGTGFIREASLIVGDIPALRLMEQGLGIGNNHIMYEKFLIEGGLILSITDRFSCITLYIKETILNTVFLK